MSLVIVIVGFTVYAIIISVESYNQRKNQVEWERDYSSRERAKTTWESYVIDRSLESEFNNKLRYSPQEIYSITSPVVCSLEGFPNSFDNQYYFFSYMRRFPLMIARIYMGISHKLLTDDAKYGVRSPEVYDSNVRELWKLTHVFMKWLDNQIRKDDGTYEMRYVAGNHLDTCRYNPSQILKLDDADGSFAGRYCWYPMIHNLPIY